MAIGNLLRATLVTGSVIVAAASATAPKSHRVNKSAEVLHGFDQTWTALIDVFSEHNWAIGNMEKDSGLITTDWMSVGDDGERFADCGSEGMAVVKATQVQFNVRVKGDERVATLTVNTKFRQERYFDGNTFMADCNSRGTVEARIQNEVEVIAAQNEARGTKRVAKKKQEAPATVPATAQRGFFCSSSASNQAAGFCARAKAECQRTRDAAIIGVGDLAECALTETSWCLGERCFPSSDGCAARVADAGVCAEAK